MVNNNWINKIRVFQGKFIKHINEGRKMNKPLISITVPVFNVQEYIDDCIISIINQTYKSIEVILIDDGSTDSSPDKCDVWAKRSSYKYFINRMEA